MHALPRERPADGVRVGSIVIRCTRFDEMRVLWQAALGYAPREAPDEDQQAEVERLGAITHRAEGLRNG